jgi:hypothetical protein
VIDVEAIARALIADAGEGAVEGAAKPVEGDEDIHELEGAGIMASHGVGGTGGELRDEGEGGEVVGVDGRGRMAGEPWQETLFIVGRERGVDTGGVTRAACPTSHLAQRRKNAPPLVR